MEKIINRYKGKGFKLTPQRLAILHYLEGNTDHPTAEDIYQEIRKKNPTVSFATVYNTVQALRDRGELLEITIDPERKHFDPNPQPHHHIMCTNCGKIDDIFIDYSSALKVPENISDEFQVLGNHVDFYGVCKGCRARKTNN
ncbi:MAG TPA: transcriptional repressor [Thermodesulfobacteriota bacterium]|nr:transcriptional repressor [Thermodesulfobacteriota bacterium]